MSITMAMLIYGRGSQLVRAKYVPAPKDARISHSLWLKRLAQRVCWLKPACFRAGIQVRAPAAFSQVR
jgi:hypothetical protein